MNTAKIILCALLLGTGVQTAFAQTNYSINGNLGLDTVPQYKLDVNGDGHFKGDVTLSEDLRLKRLESTDDLLKRLLFSDENGKILRLGDGGDGGSSLVDPLMMMIHSLDCINTVGENEPTVFWNSEPGKIYAYSTLCNFTPNVGIGTDAPQAKLDVRGMSYFQKNMGVGGLNEGSSRLQVRTNHSSLAFQVQGTTIVGGEPVHSDVFKVHGNGNVKLNGVPVESNALSITNSTDVTKDVFSVFGDGGVRIKMAPNTDNSAFWVENIADTQKAFDIKSTGQIEQVLTGGYLSDHAINIKDGDANKDVFYIQKSGEVFIPSVPTDYHALNIISADNTSTADGDRNVIIKGNGETVLQGMGNENSALTVRGEIGEQSGLSIKGNGYITQTISSTTVGDKPFALHDADLGEDVFYVRKNGEIKMEYLNSDDHALTAKIDGSAYNNVVIRANGEVKLRLTDNGYDEAFTINNMSLPAGGPQNVFNVRKNGTLFMRYTGTDEYQDVLTIKNETQDGNIFRVDGKGRVLAASVHVRALDNFVFPDYVFEPGYELMPLNKLKGFIKDNQRLPNMPSAAEVERNGLDLGEMNRLLVEKVEELTLYVLQLEERLQAVEKK